MHLGISFELFVVMCDKWILGPYFNYEIVEKHLTKRHNTGRYFTCTFSFAYVKNVRLAFYIYFPKSFYNYFENFLLLQGYPLITFKYSALMQEYRTWFIKFEIQDFKFGHIIYNWNILGLNSLSFWSTNTNTSCTSCTTFIFFEECWLKF